MKCLTVAFTSFLSDFITSPQSFKQTSMSQVARRFETLFVIERVRLEVISFPAVLAACCDSIIKKSSALDFFMIELTDLSMLLEGF